MLLFLILLLIYCNLYFASIVLYREIYFLLLLLLLLLLSLLLVLLGPTDGDALACRGVSTSIKPNVCVYVLLFLSSQLLILFVRKRVIVEVERKFCRGKRTDQVSPPVLCYCSCFCFCSCTFSCSCCCGSICLCCCCYYCSS